MRKLILLSLLMSFFLIACGDGSVPQMADSEDEAAPDTETAETSPSTVVKLPTVEEFRRVIELCPDVFACRPGINVLRNPNIALIKPDGQEATPTPPAQTSGQGQGQNQQILQGAHLFNLGLF